MEGCYGNEDILLWTQARKIDQNKDLVALIMVFIFVFYDALTSCGLANLGETAFLRAS